MLVERTVADVAPAVARNGDALEAVIERQAAGLQAKERELADFTARYKIRVRRGDEAEEAQQQQQQSQAEGMLVADQPALPSVKEED